MIAVCSIYDGKSKKSFISHLTCLFHKWSIMFDANQLVRLLCTLMDTDVWVVCRIKLIVNQMEQLKTVITDLDEMKFIPIIFEIPALIFRAIYCYT